MSQLADYNLFKYLKVQYSMNQSEEGSKNMHRQVKWPLEGSEDKTKQEENCLLRTASSMNYITQQNSSFDVAKCFMVLAKKRAQD